MGQPKDFNEYFLTLTVPEGTFAIKIKDVNSFFAFRNKKKLWNSKNELKILQKKYEQRAPSDDIKSFQKDLLNLFQELNVGVGLYEASADLSSWDELILNPTNPNSNPIKKPCK